MKINDKIKLPLDTNVGIDKLKSLVVDWKNNKIKLVNWTIIDIYYYKYPMNQTKKILLKHRRKIQTIDYSSAEELNDYIYKTFI